jgi:hypothetical protein
MAAAGLAVLVGYRDTTAGRHAHARRFAVMIPASIKALTPNLAQNEIHARVFAESTLCHCFATGTG